MPELTVKNSNTDPLILFLSDTYTRNQAFRRLRIVKDLANFKIFNAAKGLSFSQVLAEFKVEYLKNNERAETDDDLKFVASLGEPFFNLFTGSNVNSEFERLEKELTDTKTVILHLPFELPNQEAQKIGVWFKSNLGLETLYDIKFDGSLIGGCALSYRGVYKDLSLKAQIENQKQRVLATLLAFKK